MYHTVGPHRTADPQTYADQCAVWHLYNNELGVFVQLKVKIIAVVPSYRGLMKVATFVCLDFCVGFQQVSFEFVEELELLDVYDPFSLVEDSVKADVEFLFLSLLFPSRQSGFRSASGRGWLGQQRGGRRHFCSLISVTFLNISAPLLLSHVTFLINSPLFSCRRFLKEYGILSFLLPHFQILHDSKIICLLVHLHLSCCISLVGLSYFCFISLRIAGRGNRRFFALFCHVSILSTFSYLL